MGLLMRLLVSLPTYWARRPGDENMLHFLRYRVRMLAGFAAALCSIALLAPAEAAVGVNRNGVVWAGTFEGDVADLTASTPPWAVFDRNGFAAESSDGDIYSYVSGSTGTTVSYNQNNSWAGTGLARTVEARVRVPDANFAATDGVGGLVLGVNNLAYNVRFHPGFISYNDNVTGLFSVKELDTSVFHTYRAVVDQSASPIFSLYIDNDPTPVFTSNNHWFNSPGFDTLVFGDFSTGGLSGKLDTDFVSWTAGAFAPEVPEPALLGVVLLGALMLIRRRQHRA